MPRRPPGGHLGDGLGQAAGLQRLRAQLVHRAPRLGQALPGQRGRRRVVPAPRGRVVGRVLGRLQLGDDAGQALRQGVVDLPGHPGPLVQDAGLAGLLDQPFLQRADFGEGRGEPGVGVPGLAQRRLPRAVVPCADLADPGHQAHRRDVDDQDGQVLEAADPGAGVQIDRLCRAGHHPDAGDEVQLARPADDPVRVEVQGRRVEAEPRVAQDHGQPEQDQAGEEDGHHADPVPPLRVQREEHQAPRRGRRAEREVDGEGARLVMLEGDGHGGHDGQQHVRNHSDQGPRPLFPARRPGHLPTLHRAPTPSGTI